VVIPENPEYVTNERLLILADRALEEIVDRLTLATDTTWPLEEKP
jgi:hypothetical protein